MRFADRTVLVTGAAGGIGAAITRAFAAEGAIVYASGARVEGCQALCDAIRSEGGDARPLLLDVAEEKSWLDALRQIQEQRPSLDVLVNNAAINIRAPLEEYPVEAFDQVMAVNVRGVFLGMKHALPLMRRAGGGSIVNISSVSGLVGHRTTPIPYIATKGAVTLMTKGVAVQYARDNIRVNSVHPSTVDTPLVAILLQDPEKRAQRLAEVPMARLATVEEVARATLFLASSEASFITGAALPVDGGLTAY
jgi:NAD(P)-dependent dehydrogenase (short-subunit alcohol dehydrogenase family)